MGIHPHSQSLGFNVSECMINCEFQGLLVVRLQEVSKDTKILSLFMRKALGKLRVDNYPVQVPRRVLEFVQKILTTGAGKIQIKYDHPCFRVFLKKSQSFAG